MTEAEWLACEDPTKLFDRLGELPSVRKCILFVLVLSPDEDQDNPHSPDRHAERFADGDHVHESRGVWWENARFFARHAAGGMFGRGEVRLLRDIFGNPFRPVAADPSWRTSTVVALASQMYDSRDFAAMPILADALQDAGCDSADVLDHCRDPKATHVRGCWVVDPLLGKA